jgi:hypothetical protein
MSEAFVFSVYWREKHTADVVLSADRSTVSYKMYPHEFGEVPFEFENPSVEQMDNFIVSRCVPKGRSLIGEYLEYLGLSEYNPYEIVKKTHGVMFEDFLWFKFPGESIEWDDVKIRD